MSCRFPPGCLVLRAVFQEKAGEGPWTGWEWGQLTAAPFLWLTGRAPHTPERSFWVSVFFLEMTLESMLSEAPMIYDITL